MSQHVQTVTGRIATGDLGATLIHEHVVTGMPGWLRGTSRKAAASLRARRAALPSPGRLAR